MISSLEWSVDWRTALDSTYRHSDWNLTPHFSAVPFQFWYETHLNDPPIFLALERKCYLSHSEAGDLSVLVPYHQ